MKISFLAIFFVFVSLFKPCLYCQSRWMNIYYENENAIGNTIANAYDKGILVVGKHGYNYVNYNWVIKTDINGEILWNKTIGDISSNIKISAISYNNHGEIIMAGLTGYYSNDDYDPFVMKLNQCGEKKWCKVFQKEGNNFCEDMIINKNDEIVIVLRYMSTIPFTDRICLSKLNTYGEVIWTHCYNSTDTNLYNDDAKDVICTPDGGYLISGVCDYADPNPPHYWWSKPYYVKTDSLGNFQWEKVVYKDVSDKGGYAWNTVLNCDSTYYYSAISHYYYDQSKDAAAMLKMDLDGNIVDIYDIAPPGDYGKMISLLLLSDTSFAASASWGTEEEHTPKAIIIDTLGNILHENILIDNNWLASIEKTFDNKLLFLTNKYNEESDEFDAYLFKLNTELEDDTLYIQSFTYDSLCPYQIVSDTIVQDNCGLIVGGEEIIVPKEDGLTGIEVYPNPARDQFVVGSSLFVEGDCLIQIFDLLGRKVKEIKIPKGKKEVVVDVSTWQRGLYLLRVSSNKGISESIKVLVE